MLLAAQPPIVHDPIPFGPRRIAETRAYAVRHYGLHRARLVGPKVIVEHMTENTSFGATFNTFAPDVADPELHELPGTCAHFVIDPAGRIHQLVSLKWICRHTVGLNFTAIGIEHVGFSEAGVLGNARMLRAAPRLPRWLQAKDGVAGRDLIGHAQALRSPYPPQRGARP